MSKTKCLGSLAVLALLLVPAASAADPQVRFRVSEPFRVGSHDYSGGVISLHTVTAFTPSTSILEVWVNGECLGMMNARTSRSEDPPRRTEALFRRTDEGSLEMVGFTMTGRPGGTTFRFPAKTVTGASAPMVTIALATN